MEQDGPVNHSQGHAPHDSGTSGISVGSSKEAEVERINELEDEVKLLAEKANTACMCTIRFMKRRANPTDRLLQHKNMQIMRTRFECWKQNYDKNSAKTLRQAVRSHWLRRRRLSDQAYLALAVSWALERFQDLMGRYSLAYPAKGNWKNNWSRSRLCALPLKRRSKKLAPR